MTLTRLGFLGRVALLLSFVAAASYVASWNLDLPAVVSTAWKGAGLTLMAVYAASVARGLDGWLLVAVLALGALGDVLLETHGLVTGAFAFLAGHLVAITLYLRNRRPSLTTSQLLFAAILPPATVAIAYSLPADRALASGVALYALGLSLMAACAWISRFPRYLTGLGALMFVVSDLLIFGRDGALKGVFGIGVAIWALYYLGQFLICIGVVEGLARRRAAGA
ncbi:MAG: lysoplasmalogenase family protein [Phenylobacterium sp.]|uniref:lysoplasmalogenase family protein n=1 Tax=Phenylobacterium sp. TaxID=1871053 RepID=UPI00391C22F5